MAAEAAAIAILNQRIHGLHEDIVGLREDVKALDATLKSALDVAERFSPSGMLAASVRKLTGR
jgi:hypothetical protein